MAPTEISPFHAGERAMHAKLGMSDKMEHVGRRIIRNFMPDQHRELFEALPFLVMGTVDHEGRPWASLLAGRPGFVRSPDPRTLEIGARPLAGDPAADHVRVGARVGLVGIQLETRRRNRMNGEISAMTPEGFSVHVGQSFGNCPQYIHARAPTAARATSPSSIAERRGALSHRAIARIRSADTFFIASAAKRLDGGPENGVDVSHRGGRPGFVHVGEGGRVLTWPDFPGNYLFNTVGNLLASPRAGLLFVGFDDGALLSVTGRTTIIDSGDALDAFEGADRLIQLEVDEVVHLEDAVPFRFTRPVPAPEVVDTGAWPHTAG